MTDGRATHAEARWVGPTAPQIYRKEYLATDDYSKAQMKFPF